MRTLQRTSLLIYNRKKITSAFILRNRRKIIILHRNIDVIDKFSINHWILRIYQRCSTNIMRLQLIKKGPIWIPRVHLQQIQWKSFLLRIHLTFLTLRWLKVVRHEYEFINCKKYTTKLTKHVIIIIMNFRITLSF